MIGIWPESTVSMRIGDDSAVFKGVAKGDLQQLHGTRRRWEEDGRAVASPSLTNALGGPRATTTFGYKNSVRHRIGRCCQVWSPSVESSWGKSHLAMSSEVFAGYCGALVAVFFFGTCYVPAKKYPTYDGIIFQWFMCSGILMVGLVWGLLSNNWSQYAKSGLYTFPEGILGGASFAIANLLIPTVVNNLGLGVGFMLWNATNITMGYLISRFGLLGVQQTIPSHPVLSLFGIFFMLGSIGVYGMIKPTLVTDSSRRSPEKSGSKWNESSPLLPVGRSSETTPPQPRSTASILINRMSKEEESLKEALMHPELPNFGPYMMPADVSEHIELIDQDAERTRKIIGIVIALLVGAFLSCCLVPYANWQQRCKPSALNESVIATCNPLNFVFSQCLGIYLTSTVAFLLYSLFHRFVLKRSMPRSVMRPAYICGILWAIGLTGQLYSMGALGFDQAYPLSSIGPAMVSMFWSAGYFKEIQGRTNQITLAIATAMVCTGMALRMIAQ